MRQFVFVGLLTYFFSAQAATLCASEPFEQLALMTDPSCSMKAMQVSKFADSVAQCEVTQEAPMEKISCKTQILEEFNEVQNSLKEAKCF